MKKTEPNVCPHCAATDPILAGVEPEEGMVFISLMCRNCGQMWDDIYQARYCGYAWDKFYDKDGNELID